MKILLVSNNISLDPYPVFPLGLGIISKVLKRNGHEVKSIDFLSSGETESFFQQTVSAYKPQLIGIGIRNIDNVNSLNPCFYLDSIVNLVRTVRKISDSIVFLGGAGFSLMPEEILAYTGADYGIVGNAESAVLELTDSIHNKSKISPLIYSSKSSPIITGAEYDEDILKYYLDETGIIPIQTKRGCPYRCVYCSYPLLEGKKCRHRSSEEIVDEMIFLKEKFNPDMFYFTDSIFNDPDNKYIELIEKMIERNVSVPWSAFFTPSHFDSKNIKLMVRSGLKTVELGADGMSDISLEGLNKNYNFATVKESCMAFYKHNIQVSCSYIAGGPKETEATLLEGINNVSKLDIATAFIFMGIRILPDTPIEALARKEGVISENQNLLRPIFYFSPEISKEQIFKLLEEGFKNVKHAVFPPHAKSSELRIFRKLQVGGRRKD